MANQNGSLFAIAFGDPLVKLVGKKTSSISMSKDLPDTTTADSGLWASHLEGGGTREVSFDFEGLYDPAGNYSASELYDLFNTASFVDAMWGDDTTSGSINFTGSGTLNDLSIDTDVNDAVSISGTFTLSGSPTKVINV